MASMIGQVPGFRFGKSWKKGEGFTKKAIVALLTTAILMTFLSFGNVAVAQQATEFKLGFKALADQLPADVVGAPVENEYFNLSNGNSEQHTTKGLMVWRKIDNWTAYTNGYMTWINGPNGVQSRLNTDRFDWEKDPPAVTGAVPTQTPPPPQPTQAPPPSPAAPPAPMAATWQEVKRFEGSAMKDTETFTIRTDEWRIVWDTRPGQYGDMNFIVAVYKAGGPRLMVSLAANVIGAGKDTSVIRGKGDYYLSIITAQPYTILIEERR